MKKAATILTPTPTHPDSSVDLVLLYDDSGQRYRCVGSQWCGAQEWLLLVRSYELDDRQWAAKRVVTVDQVRVAPVRKQRTQW